MKVSQCAVVGVLLSGAISGAASAATFVQDYSFEATTTLGLVVGGTFSLNYDDVLNKMSLKALDFQYPPYSQFTEVTSHASGNIDGVSIDGYYQGYIGSVKANYEIFKLKFAPSSNSFQSLSYNLRYCPQPDNCVDISDSASSGTITRLNPDTAAGGVPEPSAWALMLLGFAGVGGALRQRRRLAQEGAPAEIMVDAAPAAANRA